MNIFNINGKENSNTFNKILDPDALSIKPPQQGLLLVKKKNNSEYYYVGTVNLSDKNLLGKKVFLDHKIIDGNVNLEMNTSLYSTDKESYDNIKNHNYFIQKDTYDQIIKENYFSIDLIYYVLIDTKNQKKEYFDIYNSHNFFYRYKLYQYIFAILKNKNLNEYKILFILNKTNKQIINIIFEFYSEFENFYNGYRNFNYLYELYKVKKINDYQFMISSKDILYNTWNNYLNVYYKKDSLQKNNYDLNNLLKDTSISGINNYLQINFKLSLTAKGKNYEINTSFFGFGDRHTWSDRMSSGNEINEYKHICDDELKKKTLIMFDDNKSDLVEQDIEYSVEPYLNYKLNSQKNIVSNLKNYLHYNFRGKKNVFIIYLLIYIYFNFKKIHIFPEINKLVSDYNITGSHSTPLIYMLHGNYNSIYSNIGYLNNPITPKVHSSDFRQNTFFNFFFKIMIKHISYNINYNNSSGEVINIIFYQDNLFIYIYHIYICSFLLGYEVSLDDIDKYINKYNLHNYLDTEKTVLYNLKCYSLQGENTFMLDNETIYDEFKLINFFFDNDLNISLEQITKNIENLYLYSKDNKKFNLRSVLEINLIPNILDKHAVDYFRTSTNTEFIITLQHPFKK